MSADKETFEQVLKKLEQTVEQLERPDADLGQSISLFHQGAELTKLCQEKLKTAEKRIAEISAKLIQKEDDGS